jgi:hypothetical protein
MIVEAIENNIDALEHLASELRAVLDLIDNPETLILRQALCLAALCLERKPDVVLDLGTGKGNSASVFSIVGKALANLGHNLTVHTFDTQDRWNAETAPILDPAITKRVVPHVGDLTQFDFFPVLEPARSVVVFWDAHGYAVADTVLARIMPLLAERPHVVVCHDILDNRFLPERRPYGGLPFWRGMDYFYNKRTTTEINIGWLSAIVDQILPLTDFCYRNHIEIRSFDYAIQHELAQGARDRLLANATPSHQVPLISMAYFSMEESSTWCFPISETALVRDEESFSRRGLTSLYSTTLEQPEYAARNLEVSVYGGLQPPFTIKGDAVAFAPTSSRDHLASGFFAARSHAAAKPDCAIVLEVDWPLEAGNRASVVLQTTGFDTLARIEGSAPAASWTSPAMPVDSCPERLRVALLFPDETEYLLPQAVRVLMRT